MDSSGSKVRRFILHALVPIGCSVALGFVFYQDGVFNRYHGSFQFVWSAVVASVFYYLLLFLRLRDAYLGLLCLLLLTFVTTRSTDPAFILRDILYTAAIGASVFIYFRYFRQSAKLNSMYPAVTLGGIYGAVYVIASEIHLGIIHGLGMMDTGGTIVGIAATTAFFGLSIGFAVGGGIALADKLFDQQLGK
jgi:hypothetical protein